MCGDDLLVNGGAEGGGVLLVLDDVGERVDDREEIVVGSQNGGAL